VDRSTLSSAAGAARAVRSELSTAVWLYEDAPHHERHLALG
jgi:hypothetical protein